MDPYAAVEDWVKDLGLKLYREASYNLSSANLGTRRKADLIGSSPYGLGKKTGGQN